MATCPKAPLDLLLVEDEPSLRLALGLAVRAAGHRLAEAGDGAAASALISEHVYDAVICDLRLPGVDGLTLFHRLRRESPATAVVLITAYPTVAGAVAALKEGAFDYVAKPFDPEEFTLRVIDRLAEQRAIQNDLERAHLDLAAREANAGIVGRSPPIQSLLERLRTIAHSDAPVLITGESGTGKELVARTLHELSPRRLRPFVAINCAAFPETLLEAELFGHERGAFTGAVKKRDGRFKAAHGGTLLLDEVGELALPAQAKLLRALQEGTIEPLGTNASLRVDVRVISATHCNLKELIHSGRFREDLYYRLKVLDLFIPPLRARPGDVPLLVHHFVRRFTPPGDQQPAISPRAWARLLEYGYPGNIRELANAVEHAVVLARGGEIDLAHLPEELGQEATASPQEATAFRSLELAGAEFEREYLLRALRAARGNRTRAAALLGISRKNLWEKLRLHRLSDPDAQARSSEL